MLDLFKCYNSRNNLEHTYLDAGISNPRSAYLVPLTCSKPAYCQQNSGAESTPEMLKCLKPRKNASFKSCCAILRKLLCCLGCELATKEVGNNGDLEKRTLHDCAIFELFCVVPTCWEPSLRDLTRPKKKIGCGCLSYRNKICISATCKFGCFLSSEGDSKRASLELNHLWMSLSPC